MMKETPTPSSFRTGVIKSIPIMLGYLPLGLAFGIIAHKNGLSVWATTLMSVVIFSGSGQFIAVGLLAAGANFWSIILTVFLVNSRYLLYSAGLAPYVKRFPAWLLSFAAFGITDETFAVAVNHFQEHRPDAPFWFGLSAFAHLAWVGSTLAGAVLSNAVKNADRFGLSFALVAMFIVLLIWQIKDRVTIFVAVLAAVLSLALAAGLHTRVNVLLATAVAATMGVLVQKWLPKSS